MPLNEELTNLNQDLDIYKKAANIDLSEARDKKKVDTVVYNDLLNNGAFLDRNGNPISPDKKRKIKLDSNGDPYQTGSIVGAAKDFSNFITEAVLPEDWARSLHATKYKNGKLYDDSNKDNQGRFKDYDIKQLADYIKNAPEDPNAENIFYAEREFVGLKPDGTPDYRVKYGVTKKSLRERQKTNHGAGTEILWEKRFAGAEQAENRLNELAFEQNANMFDAGKGRTSDLGSGYTEVLKDDILGLAGNLESISDEQLNKNYRDSQLRADKYNFARRWDNKNNTLWDKMKGGDYTDALEYGGVKLASDLADTALTIVGYLGNKVGLENSLKDNVFDKWSNDAARITGYSEQDFNTAIVESTNAFKGGDYWGALTGHAGALSESIFSSAPDMALMYASGGASLLSKSKKANDIYKLSKTIQKYEKLGDVKSLNKYKKLYDKKIDDVLAKGTLSEKEYAELTSQIGKLKTAAEVLGKQYGFNAIVAKQTNNIIEDRIQNGDKDVTFLEAAGIAASQYLATALDKIALENVVKVPELSKTYKGLFDSISNAKDRAGVIGKIIEKSVDVAKASGIEAGQEYIQTWSEILGKDLGVNGKTLLQALNDKKNQDEAIGAMLAGAVSGGGMHGASSVATGSASVAKGAYDTVLANKKEADIDAADIDNFIIEKPVSDSYENIKTEDDFVNNEIGDPEDKLYSIIKHFDENHDHAIDDSALNNIGKIVAYNASKLYDGVTGKNAAENKVASVYMAIKNSNSKNKEKYLKDIIKSAKDVGFKEVEDKILKTEAYNDMYSAIYEASNSERGSKLGYKDSDKFNSLEDDPVFFEDDVYTGSKNVKNKLYGKLDDAINSFENKIKEYSRDGIDTKHLKRALSTLKKYNTSIQLGNKIDNKTMEDVSNEISEIGFVSEDGTLIAPSVSMYKEFLPMLLEPGAQKNIAPLRNNFVNFSKFSNFIKTRASHVSALDNISDTLVESKAKELLDIADVNSALVSSVENSDSLDEDKVEAYLYNFEKNNNDINYAASKIIDAVAGRSIPFDVAKKADKNLEYIDSSVVNSYIDNVGKNGLTNTIKEVSKLGYISPEDSIRLLAAGSKVNSKPTQRTNDTDENSVNSDAVSQNKSENTEDKVKAFEHEKAAFKTAFRSHISKKGINKTINDSDFDKVMAA